MGGTTRTSTFTACLALLVSFLCMPAVAQGTGFLNKIEHAQEYVAAKRSYPVAPVTYSGDPIEIRFSSFLPVAVKSIWGPWNAAFKQLEKESGGKLRLKVFAGGVLHGARDGFKATRSGISDLSHCYVPYQPKSFKMMHMLGLPGLFPDSPTATMVAQELYPTYFKKEYEALGVYMARASFTPMYNFISKKPIRSLEDLKGLKGRTTGGVMSAMYAAVGGIPVVLPVTEAYTAFQRGTVDSVLLFDSAFVSFRVAEVARHHTEVGFAGVHTAYCMRPGFFDGLPSDLKVVLYNWFQRWSQVDAQVHYEKASEAARTKMKDEMGIKFHRPSEAERQRIINAMSKVIDQFEHDTKAEGLPGKAALSKLRELTAKYSQSSWNDIFDKVSNDPTSGLVSF